MEQVVRQSSIGGRRCNSPKEVCRYPYHRGEKVAASPGERMRLYRERRHRGIQYVRIPITHSPVVRQSAISPKMTKIPATAAERMRLYRQRRRQGIHYVRIPLHVTEIDQLIHSQIGRWKDEDDPRTNSEVVQAAVLTLVYRALDQDYLKGKVDRS
jgi:hypothetical protein